MKRTIKISAAVLLAATFILAGCKPQVDTNTTSPDAGEEKTPASTKIDASEITIEKSKTGFDYDLSVGKYEVTRALFKAVLGDSADKSSEFPKTAADGDERPADNVTKLMAAQFCNELSKKNGYTPYYTIEGETVTAGTGNGYRLLTQNEWETVAQAGKATRYAGTNGILAADGNDATYEIFTSDPDSYEEDSKGNKIPVYLSTSTKRTVKETDVTNGAQPWTTSNANLGDSELSKYAWIKYNIKTGDIYDLVPQPIDLCNNTEWWTKIYKYDGEYYKVNPYGCAGLRADIDDGIWGTHTVGKKLDNGWGLYDMTGNASELVEGDSEKYIGGDAACNASKLNIVTHSYETKIKGFRICRTITE